ncbi:hypothetical protein L1887_47080 [Cichorium endivia]|nr:hypothetical protein L1887_47080 [Cichorium endivia]
MACCVICAGYIALERQTGRQWPGMQGGVEMRRCGDKGGDRSWAAKAPMQEAAKSGRMADARSAPGAGAAKLANLRGSGRRPAQTRLTVRHTTLPVCPRIQPRLPAQLATATLARAAAHPIYSQLSSSHPNHRPFQITLIPLPPNTQRCFATLSLLCAALQPPARTPRL